MTQPEQGYIQIDEGKLFYLKSGEGAPLIFIHGFCLDHRMWQGQIDYFSPDHTVFLTISGDLTGPIRL